MLAFFFSSPPLPGSGIRIHFINLSVGLWFLWPETNPLPAILKMWSELCELFLKLSKLKNLVPILVKSGEDEMDQTASSKVFCFFVLSVHCLHKTKGGGGSHFCSELDLYFWKRKSNINWSSFLITLFIRTKGRNSVVVATKGESLQTGLVVTVMFSVLFSTDLLQEIHYYCIFWKFSYRWFYRKFHQFCGLLQTCSVLMISKSSWTNSGKKNPLRAIKYEDILSGFRNLWTTNHWRLGGYSWEGKA